MPNPVPGDVIERELRYAAALGVVRSFRSKGTPGGTRGVYRRWHVESSDGIVHSWTPAQVLAFGCGVRLATERREG